MIPLSASASDTYQAHMYIRSLRYWATTRPSNYIRAATFFYKCPATPGAQMGKSRDPAYVAHLNLLCRYVAADWQANYSSLDFDQIWYTACSLRLPALSTLVQEILTNGVYPMKEKSHSLPPDVVAKLTMSLASLEQALLDKDPMMPRHLQESHKLLISYPETVHLLDDDEIARLIGAAQVHTGIEIVKLNTPKTGGRKKVTADDL